MLLSSNQSLVTGFFWRWQNLVYTYISIDHTAYSHLTHVWSDPSHILMAL